MKRFLRNILDARRRIARSRQLQRIRRAWIATRQVEPDFVRYSLGERALYDEWR
jgi:hypothetical protein